jgi:hypothetical protein
MILSTLAVIKQGVESDNCDKVVVLAVVAVVAAAAVVVENARDRGCDRGCDCCLV